jgi:hypothetical protein
MQLKPSSIKPSRYRVSNLIFNKGKISFPLKEDYERRTRTLNISDKDVALIRGHDFSRDDPTSLLKNKDETLHIDNHPSDFEQTIQEVHKAAQDPTKLDAPSARDILGKDQIYLDKQTSLYDSHKTSSESTDSPSSSSKTLTIDGPKVTGSETKEDDKREKDRFNAKEDDPNKPAMYTKKGKLIKGEWVGSVFVRYKRGTPRPPDFTSEDWRRLGDAGRKAVIKQIAEERSKEAKQSQTVACYPSMPTEPYEHKHREKVPLNEDPKDAEWFASCVARSVCKREVLTNKAAKASLDKEWEKLRNEK